MVFPEYPKHIMALLLVNIFKYCIKLSNTVPSSINNASHI